MVFILIFGVGISCCGNFSKTGSVSIVGEVGAAGLCVFGGSIGAGGGIFGGGGMLGGGGGGGGSAEPEKAHKTIMSRRKLYSRCYLKVEEEAVLAAGSKEC